MNVLTPLNICLSSVTAAKVKVSSDTTFTLTCQPSLFLSEASLNTKYQCEQVPILTSFSQNNTHSSHANRKEELQNTRRLCIKTPSEVRTSLLPGNTGKQGAGVQVLCFPFREYLNIQCFFVLYRLWRKDECHPGDFPHSAVRSGSQRSGHHARKMPKACCSGELRCCQGEHQIFSLL